MRTRFALLFTVSVSVFCVGFIALGQNRDKVESAKKAEAAKPAANKPAADPEEQVIRTGAEEFVKLYNAHDSKGLAQLFAHKAEMIDENDNVVKGREAIEKSFHRVFKQHPEASIQIDVESVRVLTPSLAIEEGVTRSRNSPNDPEDSSIYVAIQAKVEGKWHLVCVRDWEAPPAELTPHERLEQSLSWMIGEWVDESPNSNIHTICNWDETGNFLIQQYHIHIGGDIAMSGTMRVGWNAASRQFQSWTFDSNGGHVTGNWIPDGERWIVKVQGVTAKGELGSATNYYRPIDNETIAWGSLFRVLDGERQPDISEVIVKRRAPQPGE